VGNYVTDNPINLGNYVTADNGSKRVKAAPFPSHVYPSKSDRRKPLRLDWIDYNPTLTTAVALDHRFQLKVTNTGSTAWLNVAQDKGTLDLLYPGRTPGFVQLFVGENLPDIPPSQSIVITGRLVETPPVGIYSLTAELVDLRLATAANATLAVTE
jgi:hypothetical protein